MQLLIDTTLQNKLILVLLDGKDGKAKWEKELTLLSESLLPELEKFLRKQKIKLSRLTKILVNPGPGAFSSTRTGVATANALAYALDVPVAEWPSGKVRKLVLPKYDKAPNITRPKTFNTKKSSWRER